MKEEAERNNKLMPVLPETNNSFNDEFAISEIKNNNVEEGIECFTHWLSIRDGNCSEDNRRNIHLTLTTIGKDKNKILLHDNLNNLDIEVVFTDGVPLCTLCHTDDCVHTGFAICAKLSLFG
ncbi:MAG TPA: hypothetical protein VJ767_05550 [Nitrososphaeraceae archaeon]|nr:hypothetical protein [Nitrososphaeraceae archaeon]